MAFPSPKLPVDNPHSGGDTVLLADVLSQDFGAALVSGIGQSIVQDRLEATTGQMMDRRSCRAYTEAMNLAGPERLSSAERAPTAAYVVQTTADSESGYLLTKK